jgi:hypothetical protein
MERRPLGSYDQFGAPGPQDWTSGTVIHGSGVVDDLVSGIAAHRDRDWTGEYWRRLGPAPAAIGCVPWLTDRDVAAALSSLANCSIVVDKQQPEYDAVRQLAQYGTGLSTAYLKGFEEVSYSDESGEPPIIAPGSPYPLSVELGPVRVAGWRKSADGASRPMLHAKVLVLGVTTYYEDDEMFAGDVLRFHPKATWMGSANWTYAAREHIEFGLWSTDPNLVERNYEHLLSLLAFSEQRGASTISPEPDLVSAVWDDAAFAEYLFEHRYAHLDEEE